MFKKILIVLVLVVAAFCVVVAMQPDTFKVERSATFAAPADAVFPHLNDLHKWQTWSPWAKKDPNAKITFSGPESGEGASFAWVGNQEIGEGSMTITESRPNDLVQTRLDFVKPFADTSTGEFRLEPVGSGQTRVIWSMSGKSNFMFKAMGLFMDCDKLIGGDFEQGLANLKGIVAQAPAP